MKHFSLDTSKQNTWIPKRNETNPMAQEPRVRGERQTDGYRTCSDLSQRYKDQLDRSTQYKWMHLQI